MKSVCLNKVDHLHTKLWFINGGLLSKSRLEEALLLAESVRLSRLETVYSLFLGLKYLVFYLELYAAEQSSLLEKCIRRQLRLLLVLSGRQQALGPRQLLDTGLLLRTQTLFRALHATEERESARLLDELEDLCKALVGRTQAWLAGNDRLAVQLYRAGYSATKTAAVYTSYLMPHDTRQQLDSLVRLSASSLFHIELKCGCKIFLNSSLRSPITSTDQLLLEVVFDTYSASFSGFLNMLGFLMKCISPSMTVPRAHKTIVLGAAKFYHIFQGLSFDAMLKLSHSIDSFKNIDTFTNKVAVTKVIGCLLECRRKRTESTNTLRDIVDKEIWPTEECGSVTEASRQELDPDPESRTMLHEVLEENNNRSVSVMMDVSLASVVEKPRTCSALTDATMRSVGSIDEADWSEESFLEDCPHEQQPMASTNKSNINPRLLISELKNPKPELRGLLGERMFLGLITTPVFEYTDLGIVNHKLRRIMNCDTEPIEEDLKFPFVYEPVTVKERLRNDERYHERAQINRAFYGRHPAAKASPGWRTIWPDQCMFRDGECDRTDATMGIVSPFIVENTGEGMKKRNSSRESDREGTNKRLSIISKESRKEPVVGALQVFHKQLGDPKTTLDTQKDRRPSATSRTSWRKSLDVYVAANITGNMNKKVPSLNLQYAGPTNLLLGYSDISAYQSAKYQSKSKESDNLVLENLQLERQIHSTKMSDLTKDTSLDVGSQKTSTSRLDKVEEDTALDDIVNTDAYLQSYVARFQENTKAKMFAGGFKSKKEWAQLLKQMVDFSPIVEKRDPSECNPETLLDKFRKQNETTLMQVHGQHSESAVNIFIVLNVLTRRTITWKNFYEILSGRGVELSAVTHINSLSPSIPTRVGWLAHQLESSDEQHPKQNNTKSPYPDTNLSVVLCQLIFDLMLINIAKSEALITVFRLHFRSLNRIISVAHTEVQQVFSVLKMVTRLNCLREQRIRTASETISNMVDDLSGVHELIFCRPCCDYQSQRHLGIRVLYSSLTVSPSSKATVIKPFLRTEGDHRIRQIEHDTGSVIALRQRQNQLVSVKEYEIDIFFDFRAGNHFGAVDMISGLFDKSSTPIQMHRSVLCYPTGELWVFDDIGWLRSMAANPIGTDKLGPSSVAEKIFSHKESFKDR